MATPSRHSQSYVPEEDAAASTTARPADPSATQREAMPKSDARDLQSRLKSDFNPSYEKFPARLITSIVVSICAGTWVMGYFLFRFI